MKKNKTLKIASILLALVLMTSCFVGNTFAKYVTSGTGDDSARVAKFGVEITANGSTFANEYATDNSEVNGTIANSVVSTDSVVAPGTKGNMTSVSLSGTPEVAVNVKYEATVTLENWVGDANSSYYCPLEIKVGDTTFKGTDYDSTTAFAAAVKAQIDGFSANYTAGTDLSSTPVTTPSVSWEWKFEDTSNSDEKDTYLGNQAVNGTAATVAIQIITTVTQID